MAYVPPPPIPELGSGKIFKGDEALSMLFNIAYLYESSRVRDDERAQIYAWTFYEAWQKHHLADHFKRTRMALKESVDALNVAFKENNKSDLIRRGDELLVMGKFRPRVHPYFR